MIGAEYGVGAFSSSASSERQQFMRTIQDLALGKEITPAIAFTQSTGLVNTKGEPLKSG